MAGDVLTLTAAPDPAFGIRWITPTTCVVPGRDGITHAAYLYKNERDGVFLGRFPNVDGAIDACKRADAFDPSAELVRARLECTRTALNGAEFSFRAAEAYADAGHPARARGAYAWGCARAVDAIASFLSALT